MNDLLFAVPWWIPTLLAVIGIALFFNGNRTGVIKIRNAGVGLLMLGVIWAAVSYFVDTDKEKVENGTRQLLKSVVASEDDGKWDNFKAALSKTILLRIGGGSIADPDKVTAAAKTGADFIKLKSATANNMVVEQTGTLITARCDIISTQDYAPIETSAWQFDWEETNEGWKVKEIRLISIKNLPLEGMDGIARWIGK